MSVSLILVGSDIIDKTYGEYYAFPVVLPAGWLLDCAAAMDSALVWDIHLNVFLVLG